MNTDDARREAVRMLASRFRAWNVDQAEERAREYISELVVAGWHWAPPENRPTPPRAEEICPGICGRHRDSCICPERPQESLGGIWRPPTPASDATRAAAIAKMRADVAQKGQET